MKRLIDHPYSYSSRRYAEGTLRAILKQAGVTIVILFLSLILPIRNYAQSEKIEKEILHNGEVIRTAFSEGDIEKIKSLHHPDVVKALGYSDLKKGMK